MEQRKGNRGEQSFRNTQQFCDISFQSIYVIKYQINEISELEILINL